MKQIINAKIVLPDGIVEGKTLIFDKYIEKIADEPLTDAETVDANGNYVIPGLIDLHIHGYAGCDVTDGDAEGLEKIAIGVLKNGVTSFLATTVTQSYTVLEKAFDITRNLQKHQNSDQSFASESADVIGVHAEGPFISMSKKGAQNGEHVRPLDADFIIKHSDIIKMVTVAPEVDKNFEGIKRIKAQTGVVISAGHTAADYETVIAAIDAGVTHGTHLFNAMSPLTHREPGAVGALLFSPKVSCELICDGVHVHPAWFKNAFTLKGRKLCLITDCLRASGLGDGQYEIGGQSFNLKGIECRLPDGTIAGSVITLNKAVLNLYKSGVPLHEAVNCASLNPAKTLGIDDERGQIKVGCLAHLVICNAEMDIIKVIKNS
jgi:N-acetylglucosamine-6-phosphate deacetylase